jgi:serine/threonine-protein kinase
MSLRSTRHDEAEAGSQPLPASAPPGDAPPPSPGDPSVRRGPPELPGYEILEELGRGGMGVVYRARHLGLKREVALKMILSGAHAGDDEAARFKTEAEAIARLQHPGIVQVFDVGAHQGHPFLSLEFCPGGSLEKQLRCTPRPPDEAASLVRELALAVHSAHQANVIHRDLKPPNVLLTADGTPKVTEFGLARKLDEAGRRRRSYHGTTRVTPEEARGGTSTFRLDYSLSFSPDRADIGA